jgi:O-glycosyl hydrolase
MKKLLILCPVFLFACRGFAQGGSPAPLVVSIDLRNTMQTIRNFGASGCWFSEGIGRFWPEAKREKIAELLFSSKTDAAGNPKGIALSAWRFNIGAGTMEQGDSSGIRDFRKRVECFLSPDGTYDWNKQSGYQWFLRKAKSYGVPQLIAFSNSPPVFFNENGRGFKTEKDYKANLRPDKYGAYADFLAAVLRHFDREGLHFNYVSPVNEPQWDWSNKPGQASQEGSPWSNADIRRIVSELNASLEKNRLRTAILAPEAGNLTYLYGGNNQAANQLNELYGNGVNTIMGLSRVPKIVAGHSYGTDTGDSAIVEVRSKLNDAVQKYGIEYWQSEYSMLGEGFREGTKSRRPAMDCALFLAKLIHQDLTVGNAAAWQWWNSYEPGDSLQDTRYYLIALNPNKEYTDGDFAATKNLWALGNYSRFIRPGMKRVDVRRADGRSAEAAAKDVMVSAYTGGKNKLVLVAINYTNAVRNLQPKLSHVKAKAYTLYVTSAAEQDNLRSSGRKPYKGTIPLAPRSVTTIVLN